MTKLEYKSLHETLVELNEHGLNYINYNLSLDPLHVIIETSNARFYLPRSIFKKFSEWYLENEFDKTQIDDSFEQIYIDWRDLYKYSKTNWYISYNYIRPSIRQYNFLRLD